VKSPLRERTGLSSGINFRNAISRFDAVKARRVAMLSGAVIMVCGVGTASALFVDYLADRAAARGNSILEVRPLVTEAVAEAASISPVAEAQAAAVLEEPAAPAIQISTAQISTAQVSADEVSAAQASSVVADPAPPKPMPIEAVMPDAAAIAKVAVGAMATEDTIDDTADDVLVSAYSDDSGSDEASSEITAAISPDEGEPEPVAKPRKAKAEKAQPAAESKNTEIASLPGVDVGGMAGHPSEEDEQSSSAVRTVTKNTAAAAGGVAAGTARIRQAVNMRSAGKKGAGVIGVVPAGATVSVVSCEMWCEISYNGRKGWVYKSFLAAGAPKKQVEAEPKKPARASSNRS
jgi:hypothetical protein